MQEIMKQKLKILTIMIATTFLLFPVFLLTETKTSIVKADEDEYEKYEKYEDEDKYERDEDDDEKYEKKEKEDKNRVVKQTATIYALDGKEINMETLKRGKDDWYVPTSSLDEIIGATVVDYPNSQMSEIVYEDATKKMNHLIVKANTRSFYLNGTKMTDDEIPLFHEGTLYIPADLLDDYFPFDVDEEKTTMTFLKEGAW